MSSPKPVWPQFFAAAVGFWLVAWLAACGSDPRPGPDAALPSPCSMAGTWVDPGSGARLAHDAVIAKQAKRATVRAQRIAGLCPQVSTPTQLQTACALPRALLPGADPGSPE